ncbi:MAG: hypothetical protein ABIN94_19635 [Ferruginibacter sp.]
MAANPQDIDIFRVGNFVEFPGYSFLEITDINESTGSKTYSVTLNGQERTGIPDGMMRGITLEEEHLYALGFSKNDHNIFRLADISMVRPTNPDDGNLTSPGWRIYKPGAQISIQPAQPAAVFIEENTTGVSTVHKLQNHLADEGRQFDFSPLRQFQDMIRR